MLLATSLRAVLPEVGEFHGDPPAVDAVTQWDGKEKLELGLHGPGMRVGRCGRLAAHCFWLRVAGGEL